MLLLYTPTSPYARKVRVLAHELGVPLPVKPVDPLADDPVLLAASVVGRVPVLLLDDGTRLIDSRVICDVIEDRAGRGPSTFEARAQEATAEAVMDSALFVVMSRRRPEGERSAAAMDREVTRIRRTLGAFDGVRSPVDGEPLDRVQVGLATSLAYLDFRLPDIDWRRGHDALAAWLAAVSARPSMASTAPPSP